MWLGSIGRDFKRLENVAKVLAIERSLDGLTRSEIKNATER